MESHFFPATCFATMLHCSLLEPLLQALVKTSCECLHIAAARQNMTKTAHNHSFICCTRHSVVSCEIYAVCLRCPSVQTSGRVNWRERCWAEIACCKSQWHLGLSGHWSTHLKCKKKRHLSELLAGRIANWVWWYVCFSLWYCFRCLYTASCFTIFHHWGPGCSGFQ